MLHEGDEAESDHAGIGQFTYPTPVALLPSTELYIVVQLDFARIALQLYESFCQKEKIQLVRSTMTLTPAQMVDLYLATDEGDGDGSDGDGCPSTQCSTDARSLLDEWSALVRLSGYDVIVEGLVTS